MIEDTPYRTLRRADGKELDPDDDPEADLADAIAAEYENDAPTEATRFMSPWPRSLAGSVQGGDPVSPSASAQQRHARFRRWWQWCWPWPPRSSLEQPRIPPSLSLALVVATTTVLSLAVGAYAGWWWALASLDRVCAAHTSHASALLEDVDIHYTDTLFNGSFMHDTVYGRPGAPEVDAAWEALGVDNGVSILPFEAGIRSGLTPDHVQRADKYGGGFLVNVEGLHHLHCLNLLRKALYFNYDYYKPITPIFLDTDEKSQHHVSHCVDTLRQVLVCTVDTGMLGQVWIDPDAPSAFPDFHSTHTCKNFDAVLAWTDSQELLPPTDGLPDDYLKAANPATILPEMP